MSTFIYAFANIFIFIISYSYEVNLSFAYAMHILSEKYITRGYNGICLQETRTLRLLKKYPNRRIYDTETSKFVTLPDVRQLVIDRKPFQVVHSKTGNDLTRSVLLQIISELEEEGHESLLTNRILEELIRFYGDRMVGFMAPYFEQQILQYIAAQDKLRGQFMKTLSKPYPSPENALKQMMEHYRSIIGKKSKQSDELED